MSGQYGFRAYGLMIQSDFNLTGLTPAQVTEPDLVIRLAGDEPLPEYVTADFPSDVGKEFVFGEDEQVLHWESVGRFTVKGAHTVIVEPTPGVGENLVALPLLGPVLALVLHLRGLFVLHASAVEVNGRGIVFMGDKGAGKSTTAGAFVGGGSRLLTDDVVAIEVPEGGRPRIRPGFPQMKLDAGASERLGIGGSTLLPEPARNFPKDIHLLQDGFTHDEVIPYRFYVLERGGEEPMEQRLAPHEALASLMRFSYMPRFAGRARSNAEASADLRRCAAIVNAVQVCRLRVPLGVERLGEAIRFVEALTANA